MASLFNAPAAGAFADYSALQHFVGLPAVKDIPLSLTLFSYVFDNMAPGVCYCDDAAAGANDQRPGFATQGAHECAYIHVSDEKEYWDILNAGADWAP